MMQPPDDGVWGRSWGAADSSATARNARLLGALQPVQQAHPSYPGGPGAHPPGPASPWHPSSVSGAQLQSPPPFASPGYPRLLQTPQPPRVDWRATLSAARTARLGREQRPPQSTVLAAGTQEQQEQQQGPTKQAIATAAPQLQQENGPIPDAMLATQQGTKQREEEQAQSDSSEATAPALQGPASSSSWAGATAPAAVSPATAAAAAAAAAVPAPTAGDRLRLSPAAAGGGASSPGPRGGSDAPVSAGERSNPTSPEGHGPSSGGLRDGGGSRRGDAMTGGGGGEGMNPSQPRSTHIPRSPTHSAAPAERSPAGSAATSPEPQLPRRRRRRRSYSVLFVRDSASAAGASGREELALALSTAAGVASAAATAAAVATAMATHAAISASAAASPAAAAAARGEHAPEGHSQAAAGTLHSPPASQTPLQEAAVELPLPPAPPSPQPAGSRRSSPASQQAASAATAAADAYASHSAATVTRALASTAAAADSASVRTHNAPPADPLTVAARAAWAGSAPATHPRLVPKGRAEAQDVKLGPRISRVRPAAEPHNSGLLLSPEAPAPSAGKGQAAATAAVADKPQARQRSLQRRDAGGEGRGRSSGRDEKHASSTSRRRSGSQSGSRTRAHTARRGAGGGSHRRHSHGRSSRSPAAGAHRSPARRSVTPTRVKAEHDAPQRRSRTRHRSSGRTHPSPPAATYERPGEVASPTEPHSRGQVAAYRPSPSPTPSAPQQRRSPLALAVPEGGSASRRSPQPPTVLAIYRSSLRAAGFRPLRSALLDSGDEGDAVRGGGHSASSSRGSSSDSDSSGDSDPLFWVRKARLAEQVLGGGGGGAWSSSSEASRGGNGMGRVTWAARRSAAAPAYMPVAGTGGAAVRARQSLRTSSREARGREADTRDQRPSHQPSRHEERAGRQRRSRSRSRGSLSGSEGAQRRSRSGSRRPQEGAREGGRHAHVEGRQRAGRGGRERDRRASSGRQRRAGAGRERAAQAQAATAREEGRLGELAAAGDVDEQASTSAAPLPNDPAAAELRVVDAAATAATEFVQHRAEDGGARAKPRAADSWQLEASQPDPLLPAIPSSHNARSPAASRAGAAAAEHVLTDLPAEEAAPFAVALPSDAAAGTSPSAAQREPRVHQPPTAEPPALPAPAAPIVELGGDLAPTPAAPTAALPAASAPAAPTVPTAPPAAPSARHGAGHPDLPTGTSVTAAGVGAGAAGPPSAITVVWGPHASDAGATGGGAARFAPRVQVVIRGPSHIGVQPSAGAAGLDMAAALQQNGSGRAALARPLAASTVEVHVHGAADVLCVSEPELAAAVAPRGKGSSAATAWPPAATQVDGSVSAASAGSDGGAWGAGAGQGARGGAGAFLPHAAFLGGTPGTAAAAVATASSVAADARAAGAASARLQSVQAQLPSHHVPQPQQRPPLARHVSARDAATHAAGPVWVRPHAAWAAPPAPPPKEELRTWHHERDAMGRGGVQQPPMGLASQGSAAAPDNALHSSAAHAPDRFDAGARGRHAPAPQPAAAAPWSRAGPSTRTSDAGGSAGSAGAAYDTAPRDGSWVVGGVEVTMRLRPVADPWPHTQPARPPPSQLTHAYLPPEQQTAGAPVTSFGQQPGPWPTKQPHAVHGASAWPSRGWDDTRASRHAHDQGTQTGGTSDAGDTVPSTSWHSGRYPAAAAAAAATAPYPHASDHLSQPRGHVAPAGASGQRVDLSYGRLLSVSARARAWRPGGDLGAA